MFSSFNPCIIFVLGWNFMLLVKLTLIGSSQVQYTENVGFVCLPSLLLHMPMATDQKWEKALLMCVPRSLHACNSRSFKYPLRFWFLTKFSWSSFLSPNMVHKGISILLNE